jgi:hypothetical protein
MAGENAESRIYLGIHYQFDAIEGIRSGDAIGDYVFVHALKPLQVGRPTALRSMDPLQQIRLSVLLESAAANQGIQIGINDIPMMIVADVFLTPSVMNFLTNLVANPPPTQPSVLNSSTPAASDYDAARDAIFWWDFETGKSYNAMQDILGLMMALDQDVFASS